jgi:hypothetical protein
MFLESTGKKFQGRKCIEQNTQEVPILRHRMCVSGSNTRYQEENSAVTSPAESFLFQAVVSGVGSNAFGEAFQYMVLTMNVPEHAREPECEWHQQVRR